MGLAKYLDFGRDLEFARLIARDPDTDLILVGLEIARDAFPALDFAHTVEWISRRAREVTAARPRMTSDRAVLEELSRCLFGRHGLHGNREAFQRAESSYLHRVVETGVGIPISLSLVYQAVARTAGIELNGVAAPLHFLTRFETAEGPLFLDAFHAGQILNEGECVAWLKSLSGMKLGEIERSLEPAGPRSVVIRLLNNLKSLHVRQEDWSAAWNVQRRLTALHPGAYEHQRDLALIAVKSLHPGQALDLLDECLRHCPRSEQAALREQRLLAEKLLADCN